MIITGTFKITTESAEEKKIFKAMKEFFSSNFQNYEFSVSGKNITLKDKWNKLKEQPKVKPKSKPKKNKQTII